MVTTTELVKDQQEILKNIDERRTEKFDVYYSHHQYSCTCSLTLMRAFRKRCLLYLNVFRPTLKGYNSVSQASTRPLTSSLFINRNFALLWAGQSISVIGDFVFDTTLVLWIGTVVAKNQPWAPLAVSGVLLMASVPAFLVGPIAGVFVDRWDKRRIMLSADLLRTIIVALLLLITGVIPFPFFSPSPLIQLIAIYAVVALVSICAQLFNPAQIALIGDLVPEHQRTQATGLSHITGNLAYVCGPPIASLLFLAFGMRWAILINAGSFFVSFIALRFINVPKSIKSQEQKKENHFWQEFVAGIRFSLGNRVLSTLIMTGMLFMFAAGIINTLYYFFLAQNLHADPAFYGLLVSAPGVGGIVGAVIASKYVHRIGEARTLWLSSLLWGGVVIALALQSHLLPATLLAFLIGVLNSGIGVVVALSFCTRHRGRWLVGLFPPFLLVWLLPPSFPRLRLAFSAVRSYGIFMGVSWASRSMLPVFSL